MNIWLLVFKALIAFWFMGAFTVWLYHLPFDVPILSNKYRYKFTINAVYALFLWPRLLWVVITKGNI